MYVIGGCDWLIDWLERQWAAVRSAVLFTFSFPLSLSTPSFSYLFWTFPPIFSLLVPSIFSPLFSLFSSVLYCSLFSSVLFCPQFSLLSRCFLSIFISSVTFCFLLISFCNPFCFLTFCPFFSLLFSSLLSGPFRSVLIFCSLLSSVPFYSLLSFILFAPFLFAYFHLFVFKCTTFNAVRSTVSRHVTPCNLLEVCRHSEEHLYLPYLPHWGRSFSETPLEACMASHSRSAHCSCCQRCGTFECHISLFLHYGDSAALK